MSGSSTTIIPFSKTGDPGCFTGTLSRPELGVSVTVVIARGVGICTHSATTCMGIVFYGARAANWTCLSDAELGNYLTWSQSNFPGARNLSITATHSEIICPPPSGDGVVATPGIVAVQRELTRLGQTWLAEAAA